jgi:hypothetical protein
MSPEAEEYGALAILAVTYPVLIGFSALIGICVERTGSVMVAVALHAWANIAFVEYPSGRTSLALGLALPIWAILVWRWPQPEGSAVSARG